MTPKSFLSFLEGYCNLYAEKHAAVAELARRMSTGLLKLDEASESVDSLSKELVVKEKDLVVANERADKVTDCCYCLLKSILYEFNKSLFTNLVYHSDNINKGRAKIELEFIPAFSISWPLFYTNKIVKQWQETNVAQFYSAHTLLMLVWMSVRDRYAIFVQVLIEVTQSAQAAEVIKASVQKVKDKAQAIVDSIAHEKGIAEVKLEAAKPALEEAEAALGVEL